MFSMNKSLLTFLLLVLAFALPGYAQEEKVAFEITFNSTNWDKVSSYSKSIESKVEIGGSKWTSYGFNNNNNGWNYVKSGANSYINNNSAITDPISSVKIEISEVAAKTTMSFLVADNSDFTNATTYTVSASTGFQTVTIPTPTSNLYYKFAVSGSGNKSASINKLTFYTLAEADPREELALSFSSETAEATVGENFTAPALNGLPEGATVSYSSSNTNVATVTKDGTVTLVAAGETTITASFAGNDSYKPTTASYILTVNPDPNAIAETITVDNFTSISSYNLYSTTTTYADYKVYAMKGATANPGLQMNNSTGNNPRTCGIIIAAKDGYYIKSITPSTSSSGKTFNVYSNSTAFTSVDDLKTATPLNSTALASGTTYTFTGETLYAGAGPSTTGAMYGNTFTVEFGKATPTVATPAISFDDATNTVTIACATEGAAVEYSLDGENWHPYTEPFVIEKDCTVSARATMADMNDSSVATLDCKWTDLNAVAAPKFSLEESEDAYLYGTKLTITATEGCTLTVMCEELEILVEDSEEPVVLTLTKDVTVTAYASKNNNQSEEVENIYFVRDPKAATASIADGEVVEGKSVSFTWEEVPGFTYTVTDTNDAVLATGNADEVYTFNTLGTVLVTLSGKVYDKTFTQDFIYEVVEKPAAEYYVLVTDASQLQNGDQIVVAGAYEGAYYAMTNTVSSSTKIQGVDVSKHITENYLKLEPEQDEVGIFTLVETDGKYAISGSKGYVSFKAGSSNNTNFSETEVNYTLTSDDENVVKFETYSGSNDRWLRLFVSDAKAADFRAYKNNSGAALVIFKKSLGKKANIAIEFAGEKECGYLEDKVKFNLKGVDEGASVSAVITDTEGNEVAAEDIEADANEVSFTAPAAHTYTVTISVGAGFNYRPTTGTSAPIHVLPMVQLISQADHYVWEAGGTIGVHAEGTNYTIRNYEHGTLEFYYKHDKNETLRANAAETADGFKKYAGEELLIKPGHTLTYYFGNEAGEKVGERSFNAAIPTGVEGIEVSADADAEYYTLQGVRVSASNLTPGLYIRRQGNTATKVMVK